MVVRRLWRKIVLANLKRLDKSVGRRSLDGLSRKQARMNPIASLIQWQKLDRPSCSVATAEERILGYDYFH